MRTGGIQAGPEIEAPQQEHDATNNNVFILWGGWLQPHLFFGKK